MEMEGDASDHRDDKRNRERGRRPVRRRETADRHHRGKMVEANDGVPEPRQHAFSKGRRRAAAHQMMSVSGRTAKGQNDNTKTQTSEFLRHAVSPRRELNRSSAA